MLRDNNTLSGSAVPDQPSPIEEYGGAISTTAKTLGERTYTAHHPSSISYVDSTNTWLAPMDLKPEIELKQVPERWPVGSKVRVDAEFEVATSTKIDVKYATDFELDVGDILADATILLAAVSQTSQWSKRVIMTLAGTIKPYVKGNLIKFRCKVIHTNRPQDGYDSLTYTATVTIKSALINWYFRPRDYVNEIAEVVKTSEPICADARPPPKKRIFRFLRAMLSPLRSTHT